MTPSYFLTPIATRDLDEILEYLVERGGSRAALHLHAAFADGFVKIAARPEFAGHLRTDLADESLRVLAVSSYLVIYRLGTQPVEIVRVIHGARDLNRLAGPDEDE
ncbi:MAG: type II toxin-antitoxin system RelE/ParE family toxin [Phycisphaerales bacterium]|nr:type II toxin-antitoxin system RelE/ParE family toxin [Phycisphaerales bacterium]